MINHLIPRNDGGPVLTFDVNFHNQEGGVVSGRVEGDLNSLKLIVGGEVVGTGRFVAWPTVESGHPSTAFGYCGQDGREIVLWQQPLVSHQSPEGRR